MKKSKFCRYFSYVLDILIVFSLPSHCTLLVPYLNYVFPKSLTYLLTLAYLFSLGLKHSVVSIIFCYFLLISIVEKPGA